MHIWVLDESVSVKELTVAVLKAGAVEPSSGQCLEMDHIWEKCPAEVNRDGLISATAVVSSVTRLPNA